ncbi:hypothetical protein B1A99_25215 [Cohnella sp. CIP 111063]|nr:hypothetical protein B1A99_25215 [Cohnella sp. CIP 111063]
MKFKAQAKHNQLLEHISTQHLVVGIDIAQQFHVSTSVGSCLALPFTSPTMTLASTYCFSG